MSLSVDNIPGGQRDAEAPTQELVSPAKPPGCGRVLLGSILMGFCFGFLFEKSHVYEPKSIRLQFVFEQWTMIKMFMGAVAGSSLCFILLSFMAPATFLKVREAFPPSSRGWVTGGLLGGCLLGAGMALGGACPGMVLPQVGSALPNSWLTLIGGLFGALVYGLVEPVVKPNILDKGAVCETSAPDMYMDQRFKVRYIVLAAPLGLACLALAVILELLVDYRKDLGAPTETTSNIFAMYTWPPSLCGFLLGCLQLPAAFFVGDSLGSTTGYQCVVSQVLVAAPTMASKFTYLAKHRTGAGMWWQVTYCLAAILGALVSAASADNLPTTARGVDVASALIGGFIMIFGSRLAGGCTSGHGISGMPLLHGLSFVGVVGMFGCGIVVAFVLKAAGALRFSNAATLLFVE